MGEFGFSAHNLVNALHGLNFSDASRYDPIKWLAANENTTAFKDANRFAAVHSQSETMNDTGQIYRNMDKIKELAGGSEEKLARLIAAGCAITECSGQFAVDSEEYKFYVALEDRGFSPELAEERRLMIELGLDYTDSDFERDTALRTEATYAPVTRLFGLAQTVGGTFAYAGGAASGNAWLFAWGMDQAYAGAYTFTWGVPSRTLTGTLISETFGLSPGEAELMAGFAGGAFTAKVPTAAAAPLSGVDDLMRVGAGSTSRACSTAGGALAADTRAISSAEAWGSYGGFPAWSGVDDLSAANRIAHEAYKDILRAQMSKPIVANVELQNILDELYRANAKIGSGSSAAALRYEKVTGMSVSGKFHEIKVMDKSRELTKWLKNNPTASAGDRAAAENVLRDMSNALKVR